MALVNTQYCPKCCADKPHTNGVCDDCHERDYRTKTAAWLAQTTEDKLMDLHKRLKRLEAGPPRY